MSDWLDELARGEANGRGIDECVLVGVALARGSCPRDAGTRMLVTAKGCLGTIGGGHLEYRAIELARAALATPGAPPRLERFPLGARLGQCCGGVVHLSFERVPAERPGWVRRLQELRRSGRAAVIVTRFASAPDDREPVKCIVPGPAPGMTEHLADGGLPDGDWHAARARAREMLRGSGTSTTRWEPPFLYEPVVPNDFDIRLFGAGHVGRALVDVLHRLPCSITWVDSRASQFPPELPGNVRTLFSERPRDEVDDAPPGSHLIVMTHSHALDQAICERALERTDLAWCGLIGSMTKRRRFEQRLLARGFDTEALARLVCPIGVDGITGKHPTEIAIAVAAQLLRVRECGRHVAASSSPPRQVALKRR